MLSIRLAFRPFFAVALLVATAARVGLDGATAGGSDEQGDREKRAEGQPDREHGTTCL